MTQAHLRLFPSRSPREGCVKHSHTPYTATNRIETRGCWLPLPRIFTSANDYPEPPNSQVPPQRRYHAGALNSRPALFPLPTTYVPDENATTRLHTTYVKLMYPLSLPAALPFRCACYVPARVSQTKRLELRPGRTLTLVANFKLVNVSLKCACSGLIITNMRVLELPPSEN